MRFAMTLLALPLVLFVEVARAADWQYEFTPYIWMTDLQTQAGRTPTGQALPRVDTDFDSLLDYVDAGWMSMFEARKGNWSILNDVTYMQLGAKSGTTGSLGFISAAASVEFEQLMVDVMAGYTPDNSHTTVYGGLRYIWLDADLGLSIATPAGSFLDTDHQRDEDWFDPVIGVRHIVPFNEQLKLVVQADVGGGYDSEFSSMSTITLNYAVSEDMTLRGGYRYARVDKDDRDLLFDQTAQGFLLAAGFKF